MKNENKSDILDLLLVLIKNKKFILIVTLFVSIVAVIYSLLAQKYWVSTSSFLPAKNVSSTNLQSQASSLLGFGSSFFGGGNYQEAMQYEAIMLSRSFAENIIREFDLIEFFEIEAENDSLLAMQIAVNQLRETCLAIHIKEETGMIIVKVETKDNKLSADIANAYWKKLEKYNIENRMTKGKQKRIFIENRLNEINIKLDSLANALRNFQKKNNVLLLEDQVEKLILIYSDLVAKEIEIDIETEFIDNFLSKKSEKYLVFNERKRIIRDKINDFESSQEEFKANYLINLKNIPDINLKYQSLVLRTEIQKKIYRYLVPQYEQAKIEEVKDLPTITVIDKAIPSQERSKPKRAMICIFAFFISLIFSSFIVYMKYILIKTGRIKKINEILKNFWF